MDLKELLGEELYNQVIEKAGDNKIAIVSDGNWFPKDKFDAVNGDNKELRNQIKDRDGQLAKLKEVDPKELQKTIDELQESNKNKDIEYQAQLDKQAFDFSLERALVNAKVRNPKAVKALLDTESIKLDGETLLGLDDQLKAIQESDPYLFEKGESQNATPRIVAGGNPNGGGSGTLTRQDIMKETDNTKRQRLIQENAHLFK